MARTLENLVKIERPRELTERKLDKLETFPTTPTLDLMDIEPCTEPGITIHVDLGLDQLEEQEE